jgi:hypothetical protein
MDALFRRQHDVADRAQLLGVVSSSTIDRMVSSGTLIVMHRGVYRPASAPRTDAQSLLGACLAAGGNARASHRGGGWLWGLTEQPFPEVLTGRNRGVVVDGCVVHSSASLGRLSHRRRIPCTNPLRTMVDLAAVLNGDDLRLAFYRGISSRLFTPEGVSRENDRRRSPGRTGAVAIDRLLAGLGPVSLRTPSVLQLAFGHLVVEQGLEWPEPEVPVLGGRYFLDYGYPDAMFGLELHGWDFHNDPLLAAESAARVRNLTAVGWTVAVYTWEDVWRWPARTAAEIRSELTRLRARRAS